MKRADFGRPSAQHRVSAWKAGFEIMRDHPFGVGWNQAVSVYDKNYSPPEGGASALTMNSYLMLGTELGLPGLICFVAYVGLALKSPKPKVQSPKSGNGAALDIGHWTLDSSKTACRAGALVFVVAFWFDGGLFNLPTAAVFWVLLELGAEVGTSRCDDLGGTSQGAAQRAVPTSNAEVKVESGRQFRHLTPPRASGRAAGSRLAGPLVAKPDGKTTGELNAIG
jgi:O-antigen ligase